MFQNLARSMRYHDTLKIECECGHKAEFSHKDAVQVFGSHASPFEIRSRLRCTKCKQVGRVSATI